MTSKRFIYPLLILVCTITGLTGCKDKTQKPSKLILITAPEIYNNRLCKLIEDAGLTAISFPTIKTSIIQNNTALDSVLLNLNNYDWIALPSRTAIKAYTQRAKILNIPLETLNTTHYCAIGKDQEYLQNLGIYNIEKNTEPSPQGIVDALVQKDSRNKHMAVLSPMVIGLKEPDVIPNFIDSLHRAGIIVTRINAYKTEVCHPENETEIVSKISNGEIDLVAFTSAAEIEALLSLVEKPQDLKTINIACFGPYTSRAAEKWGLTTAFIAEDYSSFDGYTKAIVSYFDKKE